MVGFVDSFWSPDYAGGLGVLFGKLQQGVVENQQALALARLRAEAEEAYARKLAEIVPTTDRMVGGFAKDDGASLKKAYEGVRAEMQAAARSHSNTASNLNELVVVPFGRWCEAHEGRVQASHDELQARLKSHDKQADYVRKLRSAYFNKCRQLEDLEEEDKLAFQSPEKTEAAAAAATSPRAQKAPTIVLEPADSEDEMTWDIGDAMLDTPQMKKTLKDMIETIKLGEVKIPILGVYQNVSTGSDITEYIQANMSATSVSYAERVGQDLMRHGFLRLIGTVGSTFANSSRMNYQWRPKVFKMTGVPEKKKGLDRVGSIGSVKGVVDSPIVGSMGEILSNTLQSQWNPLNTQNANMTPGERLRRESAEADGRYKSSIRRLDELRCQLEESMTDHYNFMERCELDRLKAIKAVVMDFSGAISNSIPSLQSTVDNMMLYQETIQPEGDLRYLLENYRTGTFVPKVQVYDNYYNQASEQTFGVDLETRAKADRKRVPSIVTTILTFLDQRYPDLEGDEARRGIWLVDVPLAATHHLRHAINDGQAIQKDVLERYEVPIVASVLKLYLLELPDSLISSQVYEIIKTIYASPNSAKTTETRISVLQSTLGQLRLANIATLDAIITHFVRLIDLTSAGEEYVTALTSDFAAHILRPRAESVLTMHERHAHRLFRDLLEHKEAVFGELKRASAFANAQAGGDHASATKSVRNRAASSDESQRRANMEALNRAKASRSRNSSPAPPVAGLRSHRRDKSIDPPSTRFPIHVNTSGLDLRRGRTRSSLEVPSDMTTSIVAGPPASTINEHPAESLASPLGHGNGNGNGDINGLGLYAEKEDGGAPPVVSVEKRDSFGRNSRFPPRKSGRGSLVGARMSATSFGSDSEQRGVQLVDRPMDD